MKQNEKCKNQGTHLRNLAVKRIERHSHQGVLRVAGQCLLDGRIKMSSEPQYKQRVCNVLLVSAVSKVYCFEIVKCRCKLILNTFSPFINFYICFISFFKQQQKQRQINNGLLLFKSLSHERVFLFVCLLVLCMFFLNFNRVYIY